MFRVKIALEDSPMTIDLPLDENQYWDAQMPCAGWWGKPKSEDVWPLIAWPDGRIDFGYNCDEQRTPSRVGKLEIHGSRLVPGAKANFYFDDDIWRGCVESISQLN